MKSEKSELAKILSDIEKQITKLQNMPGFISFNYSKQLKEEPALHITSKGFKSIFSPNEIAFKKHSWDGKSGFKYEVTAAFSEGEQKIFPVAGIKVFCLMTENELNEYLAKTQPNNTIIPAETA